MNIIYCYPLWHTVSFSLIAQKHVEYLEKILKKKINVIDELSFPSFTPSSKPIALVHPAIYIMERIVSLRVDIEGKYREDYFEWWKSHFSQLIGIDVADSDRISKYGVWLLNKYDKLIVPSTFAKESYLRSGVKPKVYVVPHGLDRYWYEMPNTWDVLPASKINPLILQIYLYKIKKKKKILLFWLWHSHERKGWYEVRDTYRKLRKERDDIILVLKTYLKFPIQYQEVADLGCINVYGFISELDKIMLYDLADVTLMFSRGGAFEMCALESLARGVPVVTSDIGAWTDYVPKFLQVKHDKKVIVLPNNKIHVGYGYTVSVKHAVKKINDILDNLEEYKAKVIEYRDKVLKEKYTWDNVVRKLIEVIKD